MGLMHITDLGGHSGCKILLCEEENNEVFVRKISGKVDYNERLREQVKKQIEFKSQCLRTPKVYGQGVTDDGLFYFDMEYVSGITLSEHMKTIEVGKVRNLVQMVVREIIPSDNNHSVIDESVFCKKVDELQVKLESLNNPTVEEALSMLKMHSWTGYIESACHGDLTLENIIIKDNQLYLIDFLDSFCNCWLLDISTLMQDVQSLWSYRYEEEININTLIRLILFRDILLDTVNAVAPEKIIDVYYALLLKLIRIYPYVSDEKTYSFLNDRTCDVIETIKRNRQ